MNRQGSIRRTALLATGCTLALAGGLVSTPAWAYFTAGGSGTGTATAGTLKPLVILPATTGTLTTPLYPGATGDLILTVTNPNPTPVTLRSVSQGGGVSVQAGPGCTNDPNWPATAGNSGVHMTSVIGLEIAIGGGSTTTVHLPGAASMSVTSAAACQDATFQIPVTIEVRQ